MSTLNSIFGAGSGLPDVNVNVKAFDQLSIVKRFVDQAKAAAQDLNRVKMIPPVEAFAKNTTYTNSLREGQSEFAQFVSAIGMGPGLAKPNWFKVFITNPKQGSVERDVSLFCTSAEIPAHNIKTAELRTYGVPIQLPYGKEYDPVNLTFMVDTNFKVRRFFDNWANLVFDDSENGTNDIGFQDEYRATVNIYQLSPENANIVYAITLIDAYPNTVTSMDLNHSSQHEFHKLKVQFVYSKMIVSQINTTEPELPTNTPEKIMRQIANIEKVNLTSVKTSAFDNLLGKFGQQINDVQNQVLGKAKQTQDYVSSKISSFFS